MLSIKNIKLSTRTALLFSCGLLMIISLSILLTWHFFLREVNTLELKTTEETNRQAQQIIRLKLDSMAKRSGDWAFRNDAYQLLKHAIPDYHTQSLSADSLKKNDLDLIVFLSHQGQFVDGAQLNTEGHQATKLRPSLLTELLSEKALGLPLRQLLQADRPAQQSISGIIYLDGDPMLVTVTPVTRNDQRDSPVAGWMIWAKNTKSLFPHRYKSLFLNDTRLIDIVPGTVPQAVYNALFRQKQTFAHELTDDQLTVFSILPDINQQPAAILKTTAPREYYQSSKNALVMMILYCLLGGLIITLLFFRALRKSLVTRLHLLESDLQQLARNDFSQPLRQDDKQDEISMVSQVVNSLLTTRQETTSALAEIENKFYAVYENASQPMLITHDRHVLSANQAAASLLGYDCVSELMGYPLDQLLRDATAPDTVSDAFYQRIAAHEYYFEWDITCHQGWQIPCELEITPIDHDGMQALLICLHDISERRQHENKIRRLVLNDSLTGLYNRYALSQQMLPVLKQLAEGYDQRFALLYINLDRFRALNDTFGHDTGDGIIKTVALRLQLLCESAGPVTLARIAGDEFVIFIPQIATAYQPVRLCYQIQRLLLQPLVIDGVSLEIYTTISVVIGGNEYKTVEDVLRCADFAMSKAKKLNKRIQVFSQRMYQEALETLAIQRDLPSAIRNGAIKPVFQPIVDCSNGEVIGFEALARWQHERQGPISPSRFIPMAEESNLIVELGEQVLQQACQFMQQVNAMRAARQLPPLSVHVNFAAHHFSSMTLPDNLRATLAQSGLAPDQLVIEITESMLIERPAESIKRMKQIKELGVKLALDDFGTGYSALNTLCQYPLDIVKLDRSFVLRLMDGQQGEALVRAIINMAKDLNLIMVAEGVETEAQMQKIKELGVNEIQGFYYHRPMAAADVMALFE